MEKVIKFRNAGGKLILLVLVVCLFSSFNSIRRKDCNPLILLDEAVKRLKKFTLIKDYQFNFREKKKKGDIEMLKQMVTLNRGVRYRFLAVENTEFEGKPVVTIFTGEDQKVLIASSYSNSTQKFYDQIEFECKTTGNYCLSFYFKDGMEGCAVGVYSFLKD